MCADVYELTFVTMLHLVVAQKFTKMWAEIYKRPFVNVRRRLRTHVRNYAALGCCAEVYENVGRGLRTPVRKCAPTFTNSRSQLCCTSLLHRSLRKCGPRFTNARS